MSYSNKLQRQQYLCDYNREKSVQRLRTVIKNNFQYATLLTLYINPTSPTPPSFVRKCLGAWVKSARRVSGSTYKYVRITASTAPESDTIAFHHLSDLPAAQCEKIAENWMLGNAKIEYLSGTDLNTFLQSIHLCPGFLRNEGTRYRCWTCGRGIQR